jgi:predicted CoA-binding protein
MGKENEFVRYKAKSMKRSVEVDSPNYSRIETPNDAAADILKTSWIIAVVGLSTCRQRPSYGVGECLKSSGYRMIPVNPHECEVLGEEAVARLEDIPEKVDIVNVFRRPSFVPEIVDSAIRIGARDMKPPNAPAAPVSLSSWNPAF